MAPAVDQRVGIERSEEGWDSPMMEYQFVYEHRGVKHMLYNGNGFGETGFDYAVMTEDDRVRRCGLHNRACSPQFSWITSVV